MDQTVPLVIFIVVVLGFCILLIVNLARRSERRMQRSLNPRPLDKNQSKAPDASKALMQFAIEIMPDDYKESSLAHPKGKFYGALFGIDQIVLRLPADKREEAIAAGGERTDRREWIQFRYDWGTPAPGAVNRDTIRNWCWVARQYAGQGR